MALGNILWRDIGWYITWHIGEKRSQTVKVSWNTVGRPDEKCGVSLNGEILKSIQNMGKRQQTYWATEKLARAARKTDLNCIIIDVGCRLSR